MVLSVRYKEYPVRLRTDYTVYLTRKNLTVTLMLLPQTTKLKKPSAVARAMYSRQRTLEQLYIRRATVENAIRSLEIYAQATEAISRKLVALR
jgi:hypothetical protein